MYEFDVIILLCAAVRTVAQNMQALIKAADELQNIQLLLDNLEPVFSWEFFLMPFPK